MSAGSSRKPTARCWTRSSSLGPLGSVNSHHRRTLELVLQKGPASFRSSEGPLLLLLPTEPHLPSEPSSYCEPSALESWILEVLYCNSERKKAFLQILSTEGRDVCLCWALLKPKGPTEPP